MKLLFGLIFILSAKTSFAQINVIPRPAEVKQLKGFCVITEPVGFILIDSDDGGNDGAQDFEEFLRKKYHIKKFIEGDTHSYGLPTEFIYSSFTYNKTPGYYKIEVKDQRVNITGSSLGVFYAFETLKQLVTKNKSGEIIIPNCIIKDHPRFAYRGMHLDVCRHFFSVDIVKKYIDWLAMYKFNTFHWHLTDDQGWRIEIKKYPLLTKVGGCRAQTLVGNYGSDIYDGKSYCGFYTQQQIREVVAYAKNKHITIIPEIEMPGHAVAALASYPYLGCTKGPYKTMETWGVSDDVFCAGNDSTYRFIENVLDEVIALFPSKYIHIGGDECPKERWKSCPVCQQRMKTEKLKDEKELQSYFVNRIGRYLETKGRKLMGWDEILEGGLAPNATVMSWRGEEGGIDAAKQGHDVVMTPGSHCYFDHSQSLNEDSLTIGGYLPLEKVYAYEPVPAALSAGEAKHILGAQGNVWTEYIANESKLEYMIFPRMAALAEVLWSPKEKRDLNNFEQRLPAVFKSYEDRKIHYSAAYYDLTYKVLPAPDRDGVILRIESRKKGDRLFFHKDIDPPGILIDTMACLACEETTPYEFPVKLSGEYGWQSKKAGSNMVSQHLFFNKATGKDISLANAPSSSYPGDGPFTLVNGIQNTKGMAKSSEFLGFNGTDLDVVIDLGTETDITKITLHAFQQTGSWIYPPFSVNTYLSDDGKNFTGPYPALAENADRPNLQYHTALTPQKARYVRVVAKNYGIIPSGNPGAGNTAWLFADEIEIQ